MLSSLYLISCTDVSFVVSFVYGADHADQSADYTDVVNTTVKVVGSTSVYHANSASWLDSNGRGCTSVYCADFANLVDTMERGCKSVYHTDSANQVDTMERGL